MTAPAAGRPGKYLVFKLAAESYGVPVLAVREIIRLCPITPVANMPPHVRGVINLRGVVLPIVDLGVRLGLPGTEPTARHVIIVAQVGERAAGLLVDSVSDILSVEEQSIQPTPDVASNLARTFVRGVIAMDGRMISVITLDHVLPAIELEAA